MDNIRSQHTIDVRTTDQRCALVRRYARTLRLAITFAAAATILTGCLLASGEETFSDARGGSGNLRTAFVSAEGQTERSLPAADAAIDLRVIAIVTVASGDLRVDILQPDGSVAFAVEGRPDEQVTRTGQTITDEQGRLHYRVVARGARDGSYQLLFQPSGEIPEQ